MSQAAQLRRDFASRASGRDQPSFDAGSARRRPRHGCRIGQSHSRLRWTGDLRRAVDSVEGEHNSTQPSKRHASVNPHRGLKTPAKRLGDERISRRFGLAARIHSAGSSDMRLIGGLHLR